MVTTKSNTCRLRCTAASCFTCFYCLWLVLNNSDQKGWIASSSSSPAKEAKWAWEAFELKLNFISCIAARREELWIGRIKMHAGEMVVEWRALGTGNTLCVPTRQSGSAKAIHTIGDRSARLIDNHTWTHKNIFDFFRSFSSDYDGV